VAKWMMRLLGMRVAQRVFRGRHGAAPLIDIGFGWSMLRDARVPSRTKIAAFGLGCVILMFLQVLELPVELLIAAMFNVAGIGFDLAWNGVELMAGPVLLASMLIPRLAPAGLVERLRAERYGVPVRVAARR
jgi:hypothetical protein